MNELLVHPSLSRLALALLHFLWQGTLIALVVASLWRLVPTLGPQRRYALALAAMGLMGATPVATFVVLNQTENVGAGQGGGLIAAGTLNFGTTSPTSGDTGTIDSVAGSEPLAWQPYVLAVWLVGVFCLGARLVSGYLGTLWLRRSRLRVPQEVAECVAALGRRLRIDARRRVYGSLRVTEAVAVGFWRPVVLVPMSWLLELPPSVLEAVIAHELAHIRRWDLWATLAQRAIETLLFYHPAVWWLSRRVSLEREMCCDELAVAATGRRVAYAKVLETLGRRHESRVSLVFATSFKGEADMNLLMRVRQVLGLRTQPEAGRGWLAGAAAIAVVLGVVSFIVGPAGKSAMADDPEAKPREGEREGTPRRSAEGESPRRSAEGETPRRSAEGEGARRPAEGEGARRPAEGEGARSAEGERGVEGSALRGFRPQTEREEGLYKMLQQLERQNGELRRQIEMLRANMSRNNGASRERPVARDGDRPSTGPRDGDAPRSGAREGDGDKPRTGPRDGERPSTGPRDGEKPRTGPRDGDAPRTGERDGDRPKAEGAKRDGE